MSLNIEVDDVYEVLLADGWHEVADRSFDLDSYEFHWGNIALHGGGSGGVCATGFTFKEAGVGGWIAGPFTAVLAIRRMPSLPPAKLTDTEPAERTA